MDLWSDSEADELLRVVGSALARVADAAVAFYVQTVESDLREQGATAVQLAEKNARAATMAMQLGQGLGAVFAHHMQAAVARQRLAQADVTDRAVFRVVVGFVDLVGFTPLSHRMTAQELSSFVSQFESRAFRMASQCGGRIIKHIGDEVMFVTLEPVAGCELALALMAEFADERIQPRGGLAFGEVVTRQGDYYGEVVNLASRLTDLAIPGEVLVDGSVQAAAQSGPLVFEPAGRRLLKGFDEPVAVYSVSRRPSPANH
jgi:adenylate cyclase